MSRRIRISWSSGEVEATLVDTPTAAALLAVLPVQGTANLWGDEVYFDAGFVADAEPDARAFVDPGDVCYWVQGQCLALLYGPTPASQQEECRLISEANVLGKLDGDPRVLDTVCSGERLSVIAVE